MKKNDHGIVAVVAPDLRSISNYPAINSYPCGQTIGYLNFSGKSHYIRILDSEPHCLIPLLEWTQEVADDVNNAISSAKDVHFYWLHHPVYVGAELTQFTWSEQGKCFCANIKHQNQANYSLE